MYLEAEEMRFIREWSVYAEPKPDIRRLETGRMTKAGTMSRYKWILFYLGTCYRECAILVFNKMQNVRCEQKVQEKYL